MHIDAVKARDVQHVLPQDLTECCDDDQIRLKRAKLIDCFQRFERFGLQDVQAALMCKFFYRRRLERLATAGRRIGLGYHCNDVVAMFDERGQ